MKSLPSKRRLLALLLALALAALSACAPAAGSPAATALASPSATSFSAATATPTIVWFPPTPTFTPYATQAVIPTPEMHPGLGDVLVSDGFSSAFAWQTSKTEAGSVVVENDELDVALHQPQAYLSSLLAQPVPDNFYVEITASPSLCMGNDTYGLLLRATGTQNFYRLLLSCSGQIRLERIVNGQVSLMQDWTPSGQVPPGAPGAARIAVWAVGPEIRVFVNDIYQFSARDPVLSSGSLGVFARSGGQNDVTVSFTELVIRQVTAAVPRPPTPTPGITPTLAPRLPTATS